MISIHRILRFFLVFLLAILILSGARVAYVRANSWPCGRLDSDSGCVISVALDIKTLGLQPSSIRVGYLSFDLAWPAEIALVGFSGAKVEQNDENSVNRHYAMVALFNARSGRLIRVLRQLRGNKIEGESSRGEGAFTFEVALSRDGSLAASYAFGEAENSLIVQRTADGSLVKTIFDITEDEVYGCTNLLDFTPDNQALECGSTLYRLDSNQHISLTKNGDYIFPRVADFSSVRFARAPDGTMIGNPNELKLRTLSVEDDERFAELKAEVDQEKKQFRLTKPGAEPTLITSPLKTFSNVLEEFMFSPNSQLFMETTARREDRSSIQRILLSPVRALSAIAIWTRDGELKRLIYSNKLYESKAWSRDSKHFAVVNDDFTMQVFTAP